MTANAEASNVQPSADEVRSALGRIVASSHFRASPQLAAFLRFVVEAVLAGAGGRIKGYTIAVEALGRDASFNPQTDPIVRVEAARLRRALERYYADEGANDPVVIDLPRGGYVPSFLPRAVAGRRFHRLKSIAQPAATFLRSPSGRYAVGGALLFIGAIVFGAVALLSEIGQSLRPIRATAPVEATAVSPRTPVGFPVVYIEPVAVTAAPSPATASLRSLDQRISGAFSRFDEIQVVASPPNAVRGSFYRLTSNANVNDDGTVNINFRLIDANENNVVWSHDFERLQTIGNEVIQALSTSIAQPYGAIMANERKKLAAPGKLGPRYACLLDAFDTWPSYDEGKHNQTRACLEQLTAVDPTFSDGFAALAVLYMREYAFGYGVRLGDPPPLDRALAAAQRAVTLKPEGPRAHQALLEVSFFRGDFSRFVEEAEKAIALNPYDMYPIGAYGTRLIFMGEVDKGLALLQRFLDNRRAGSSRILFALALGHYLKEDYQTAAVYADRITNDRFSLGLIARTLAALKTGDRVKALQMANRLTALKPAWRDDTRGELKKFFASPAIVDRIARDLALLGLGADSPETTSGTPGAGAR